LRNLRPALEEHAARMRSRPKPKSPMCCACGECSRCITRYLASEAVAARRLADPFRRDSENYHAAAQRQYKEMRLKTGVREYWMIGYDGPAPRPTNVWPRIIHHAQLFGLLSRVSLKGI